MESHAGFALAIRPAAGVKSLLMVEPSNKFRMFARVVVAAGALAPAATLNGTLIHIQCDDEQPECCRFKPEMPHVDRPEPERPYLGTNYLTLTTSSTVGGTTEVLSATGA